MNKTLLRRGLLAIGVVGVELSFAYQFVANSLTAKYNLGPPNLYLDAMDVRHLENIMNMAIIPFVGFNLFLVLLLICSRIK
ncbi:TPA: hypothetical protein RUY97_002869 [Aeromonas dhakensis]|nr:hypothetical protein [Aeromonas dhakensis]HDX8486306.1 hypothetical protein [Aeromonas dhakensis]HDX8512935.1 hypothetical protein [Aeromonas dhakensis]HDZ8906765.1 hypothetical protein [Aeromonas dhakensis]HDZ9333060.1 hypothetical protein [Aeromonas dhakensis]